MATIVHESPRYDRRATDGRPVTTVTEASVLRTDGIRVSWGGIIGGVLLALGLLVLLTSLGAAIGISAVQPEETDASTLGRAAGIFAAVSLLLALFVGGWASTRMGAISDRATAFCEGALVWVVSILFVGYLAASGIGSLAGGAFKLVGGASQAIGSAVGVQTGGDAGASISGNVDQILARLRDPKTAEQIAKVTGMPANEVQANLNDIAQRVEAARNDPAKAASEAKQGMAQMMERVKSSGAIQQKAEEMKPAASKAAWITFGALLLSLVTAVIGAMVGRRESLAVPVTR